MDKINTFIKQFTDKNIGEIRRIGRRYFLVNTEQNELSKKIKQDMFSIGMYLGETKKYFKATPGLIEVISHHSEKKVVINKKAEWLFLCGRDVFTENMIKENDEGIVLVQNELDENLGFGTFTKGRNKLLKNVLDKGNYLRREN